MSSLYTRVGSGDKIRLSDIDSSAPKGASRDEAKEKADKLGEELSELVDLLFFAGTHGLLIVLQGMDTSGKDGTIRRLLQHTNAQSLKVWPFKVPTPLELSHDFLWRVHPCAPGKGQVSIFNRSHYEDVLVVRVHELAPKEVWKKRYDHIRAFEQLLVDSNTIVLKFFLHISKSEQEERLLAREQEVEKAWKLNVGDWKEREFWGDYQEACEDAINKCSTDEAPWIVVPSNAKWHRDHAVMEALVEALRPYKKGWLEKLEGIGERAKADLEAFRQAGSAPK